MLSLRMLHTSGMDRLPRVDGVAVVCDRCGRPGWRLEVSPVTGEVSIAGARIAGGDGSAYWAGILASSRAHRYRAGQDVRPGAFILPADGLAGYGSRDKLVCIGRRHPRYERVVTQQGAERAYAAAVESARSQIRLSEISSRP